MSNRINCIAVSNTEWTKIATDVVGAYFEKTDPEEEWKDYCLRIVDTGDDTPTTAIDESDLKLFQCGSHESYSIPNANVDIHCRVSKGSGNIKVLA